ncbi:MAG: tRNA uridine-5-carboxymethylaminomethyl(34) synthesis enzyme MnmG [Puniceicoccales bacterium]|jgi:tRNA uridine 5-carboxymethylaminomethyl modification enzyme|nr:tRNA uridine-5-carboxymethylaminomethyl(34) synthesis enzyme MnmG [Puniceicoccales bacterium]
MERRWDVVVVGAGHAGCEAAAVCAKKGLATLLVTGNGDRMGHMACNPAIGGLGKGHMVREIDAMGGLMGKNADHSAIQYRLLNRSRGSAVQGLRAQCDRHGYARRMAQTLMAMANLFPYQAIVTDLCVKNGRTVGVQTATGEELLAEVVILAVGTFLRGQLHCGDRHCPGGRLGDFSSTALANSLQGHGIALGRMKTGTSARILGSSIDFSPMERQDGDEERLRFSFAESCEPPPKDQVACYITRTTAATREVVGANRHNSPLLTGQITGRGPRYCPSIEDKYIRFPNRVEHQLFLEPESRSGEEWYVNGLSTSFPLAIQRALLATIPGLERAHIVRPAHAVEYDYAPPTQLQPTLESRAISHLFFAGQVNGTSGYEEAAAQGLVAGINAAALLRGEEPFILGRHEAYIGVLVDDLVNGEIDEPYRMLTGRAEHRLFLNADGADLRLLEVASRHNLLPPTRLAQLAKKRERVEWGVEWLERTVAEDGGTLANGLRCHGDGWEICGHPEWDALSLEERREAAHRVAYAGYRELERRQVERMLSLERMTLPADLDYGKIAHLSTEARQRWSAIRPTTLGQARRSGGAGSMDLHLLELFLDRWRQNSCAPVRSTHHHPVDPTFAIAIPARYASSRFPGKVLADLGGRPVLRHVWERAMAVPGIAAVYILTDEAIVQNAVESWGGTCLMTPPTCATGSDRIVAALPKLLGDFIINVQGDEPFFAVDLVGRMVARAKELVNFAVLTPVYPLTDAAALFNPNTVKVVRCHDGRALYFSRQAIPHLRGVDPSLWHLRHGYLGHMGIYCYPRSTLENLSALPPSPLANGESLEQLQLLEAGLTVQTILADTPTIAIDTPDDLLRAQKFLAAG